MCGLVGIAGNLESKDELTMKKLLVLDYFRGVDSTGFAAVRDTKEIKLAKAAVNPLDLFDMGRFKDALSGYNSRVFLGHNRAATKGSINNVNAHPFQFGSIVGAHNGTLDVAGHNALESILGEHDALDSRLLIKAISVIGVKDTIEEISGAWSLVWYDKDDDTINFLRNKERPMWYAFTEDFRKIIWASEYPMIRAALDIGEKQEYKLHTEDDPNDPGKGFTFFGTQEDVHYKWSLLDLRTATNGKKPKAKVKTIKGKEKPPVVVHSNPYKHIWDKDANNPNSGGVTTDNKDPFGREIPAKTSIIKKSTGDGACNAPQHFTVDADNPYAGFITKDRFYELTHQGCSWCGCDLEWGEPVSIHDRTNSILCHKHSPGGSQEKSRLFMMETGQKSLILVENNQ